MSGSGGSGDLGAFRMDAVALGALGSAARAPSVAPPPGKAGQVSTPPAAGSVHGYPEIEGALADEKRYDDLVSRLRDSLARLKEASGGKGGSAEKKAAAKKAARAYENTLALLEKGWEERKKYVDAAMKEVQTKAKPKARK